MMVLVIYERTKVMLVKNNRNPDEIPPDEWMSINQFLYEIKSIDSPCISIYYPYGKGPEMMSLLKETKRNESLEKIESQIERKILQLKDKPVSVGKFAKTLCIFGWIKNNKVTIQVIGISKKLPYVYMANKKPFIKPFKDILKANYAVLIVTLDQKSARMQKFHGSQIVLESKLRIDLQGRHRKGGQSQGRFLRARQTKIHIFFKKIANKIREMDLPLDLILLGGVGHAKTEFFGELDSALTKKCMFVENLSFSTPINDIKKKVIYHLSQYRRKYVSEIIERYERLVKQGLTAKRNDVISKALEIGAVDVLIVSANYYDDFQFKKIVKMLEVAKHTSCKIEFVSSPKIIQKLELDNSVLAILRYKIK